MWFGSFERQRVIIKMSSKCHHLNTHKTIVCWLVQHVTDKAQSVLSGISLDFNLVAWVVWGYFITLSFIVNSGLFNWHTTTLYILFVISSFFTGPPRWCLTSFLDLWHHYKASIMYSICATMPQSCYLYWRNNCRLEAEAFKLQICIEMVYFCPFE